MPLVLGARLGAYDLLAKLGEGGMGEVYRAHDSRLGREVALKVLPPDVTNDPARLERFDREARAIAALNHPHIVTIYSTEEADGIRFLTMELVEGQTLTELIAVGSLPIARFLEIAIPLADALSAAHQKHITHRDLKPGNVMVSREGRVKVLDFGLARVSGAEIGEHSIAATQAPITHLGMIVGTMPYMSPEQVEGRPLDPRSDLFSLGIIFYELLSGERPFKGESSPALMSAILRDTPSSVTDTRADVPDAVARLISRCLEKRPDDRVQTARDVYNELRHVQKQLESGARSSASAPPLKTSAPRSPFTLLDNLWIAVLPFSIRGADADAEALAAGLTEDITTSLAKFHGLFVVAPQTARAFKDSTLDVRQIAERIGARYMMGGNVRKSGTAVRATAQLIDAQTGAQMWTETYDRRLEGTDIFAIQDDLTDHVVATVADVGGVLANSMVQSIRQRTTVEQSTADQLMLRGWGFQVKPNPADHAELRTALEAMTEAQPDNAEVWATLAATYMVEHSLLFNPLPDPLGRALRAARRAIEIDRSNQHGWQWLAVISFYLRDKATFEEAGARAMRLNPRNAHAAAWIGAMLTHAGEYDRGCALTERAMAINPGHPGWLHFSVFNRHFARGEYGEALNAALRVNIPDFFWMPFAIAAAAGQLGRTAEGKAAVEAMVRIAPPLGDDHMLREFVTRWYWPEELIESLLEGVQRSRSATHASSARTDKRPPSGSGSRAAPAATSADSDSGSGSFLINVRPFEGQGSDADTLAAGLTQSIVVGLSRYAYLRVVTRATAPSTIATGYVLQGSVRVAGKVRIVIQLTEAASGTSIWAETYDRELGGTSLFEMQDALTATIVATIADANGALVRSMANLVRRKPADTLTPYEAVLWRLAYVSVLSPAEHAQVRDALEGATTRAPEYGAGWAALAGIYVDEYAQGYNLRPDPLGRAREAAHKALECDAANQAAYVALALIAFFTRDMSAFHAAKDRALTLNPLDTGAMSLLGALTAYAGDWVAGLALSEKAMSLNPDHPGVYRMTSIFNRYRLRDYGGALDLLNRVTMPNYPNSLVVRAAIYGQLGRIDEGRALVRDAEAKMPGITDRHTDMRRKWLPKELADHIQEGLDKLLPTGSSKDAGDGAGPSIAVLPFTDLSPTKDQDWFCDGIAEEILNALSPLPGLRVAARASAFSLRGKTDDLRVIGEKLNVKTVLEGSVRRAGDRVRITAQLSDVVQGRQLWSERFDRELKDIFDVQDEIARAIVERLKVTLVDGGRERLVPKATANIEAYELLLKGRVLLTRRGRAIVEALSCFEQAIALDPNLSEAHALLGDTHRLTALYGLAPPREAMPRARAAVERALAIDPNQVEALAAIANITAIYDWDIPAADALSERALAVDPSHVRALAERAIVLAIIDRPAADLTQKVLDSVGRARALDPLNAWVMGVEAFVLAFLDYLPEAVDAASRGVALDENNFTAHWTLVMSLAWAGRDEEARRAADLALEMSGRHPLILTELAAIHAVHGDVYAAEAIHAELRERSRTSYIGFAERAAVAASAGHPDEARSLVAQAIAARDSYLAFWKLPAWRAFWKDPEGAALLRSTKLLQSFAVAGEMRRSEQEP